ncbi:MAG: hypothetical protein ACREYC_00225 [Gammaproteobacteria bacterium]
MPLLTVTGLPMLAVPSLNCTVPTDVAGVTLAVSVTGVPWVTGEAGDVDNVVVVVAVRMMSITSNPVTSGAKTWLFMDLVEKGGRATPCKYVVLNPDE